MNKTVIINRAIPGSGKTTLSKNIFKVLKEHNINIKVHSTDEFFMVGNKYCFDITKLYEYHLQNFEDFKESLKNGVDVVVCDNTNLEPWEALPYYEEAKKYNYQVILMDFLPRELSEHVKSQQVTPEKPDAHEVPEEVLAKMMETYYNYCDLLDENNPILEKHINHKWDKETHKKIISEEPITHFKYDKFFQVTPESYHELANTIGNIIYKMLSTRMILLFSHKLTESQKEDAIENLGVDEFISLDEKTQSIFSNIPPELDKIGEYLNPVKEFVLKNSVNGDYVLIQGDFGAVCEMVKFTKAQYLKAIYSTTKRETIEEKKDDKIIKTSYFRHVRFRKY